MRIQALSFLHGLPSRGPSLRSLLLVGAVATLTLMAAACSGDDDTDATPTPEGGRIVTAAGASPTPSPARAGGTLVPVDTPTPDPSATAGPSGTQAPDTAAFHDMAPCGAQSYYDVETFEGDVPVLTYSDVPEGTPILFPFDSGELKLVDAREGAITLVYEIENVGVLSIHAAGSNTLDRTVRNVGAGSVIGHFAGPFDDDEPEAFEGYQLLAAIGTEELVRIGDEMFAGEPLTPAVTDCLVLP